MKHKIVFIAAIIATALATVSVAAQEMASANSEELALKLMAFISYLLFIIYVLIAITQGKKK